MKIAITVWQDRISPVFDTSQWLEIFNIESGEAKAHIENIEASNPFDKVRLLKELKVDVLLCGAITRPMQNELIRSGIDVLPFVCGKAGELLDAFFQHKSLNAFAMPGYNRQTRHRRRGFRQGCFN